jgi:hypothetical protein
MTAIPNPTPLNPEAPALNYPLIIGAGGVLALVAVVAAWFFMPGLAVTYGIALGFILASANLVFLTKIVAKMLNQNYSSPARTVLLIAAKLAFIVGVFYLAFRVFQVDALGFAGGYFCLMISMSFLKGRTPPVVGGQT